MSEKWEVVSGNKKKRVGNGHPASSKAAATTKVFKENKVTLKSSFPTEIDISELIYGPDAAVGGLSYATDLESKKLQQSPPKKVAKSDASKPQKPNTQRQTKSKEKEKRQDLETALRNVSVSEMEGFFVELQNAGSIGDVYLSWIKYSADALNTKLHLVLTPDSSQWPNAFDYPRIPNDLEAAIRKIISQTVNSRPEAQDVMGVSFSSLLANIPTLIQRNDPGWGYLLFLREICRLDPNVLVRRSKSFSELMESYGNKKEIGLCVLWVAAQAAYGSPHLLKIVVEHLLPFYNFKHYKSFVLSSLAALSSTANEMAGDSIIEPDEFEEFFEASFDPKRRRDFEKFYPRIKDLTLRNIKKKGSPLFMKFLQKVGEKEFLPMSAYGKEVFDILHGILEADSSSIDKWRENVGKYSKESAALLNSLSKNAENIKIGKTLETKFIQSDEFAVAAVKAPELLRGAKKLQTGFKRVEASRRKRFSWKMGSSLLLLTIIGILWLDITENGQGSFEKSNTGKLLEKYGVLDETLLVCKTVSSLSKAAYDYSAVLFRSVYEGVRPVLQSLGDQVQVYIPQLTHYFNVVSGFFRDSVASFLTLMQDKVFVGVLAPENLRHVAKESLGFIWTNVYYAGEKMYELIERYVQL